MDRHANALHIAAQAVVAERLGVIVDGIELGIDETFPDEDNNFDRDQLLTVELAGPFAEPSGTEGHDKREQKHVARAKRWASTSFDVPDNEVDDLIEELSERARLLVDKYSASIAAVAKAAEDSPYGILSGDDLRRLLDETSQ